MQLHINLKIARLLKIKAVGVVARKQAVMSFHMQKKLFSTERTYWRKNAMIGNMNLYLRLKSSIEKHLLHQ